LFAKNHSIGLCCDLASIRWSVEKNPNGQAGQQGVHRWPFLCPQWA